MLCAFTNDKVNAGGQLDFELPRGHRAAVDIPATGYRRGDEMV